MKREAHYVSVIVTVLFQRLTGRILEANGGHYLAVLLLCGSAYAVARIIIHFLAPRVELDNVAAR